MDKQQKLEKKKGLERLVVLKAKDWRAFDIVAIGDKGDRDKQQDEYKARRVLAKTVDDLREH